MEEFDAAVIPVVSKTTCTPVPPQTVALTVKISYALGLRKADFMGKSDPYVVVQVPNRMQTKVETHVKSGDLNPVWNCEFEVPGYKQGEDLVFKVLDKDPVSFDILGVITFPATSFQETGFDGEVLLEEAKGSKPYLKVSISGPTGKYPQEMAAASTFVVALTKPLGIELDATLSLVKVCKIAEGGSVSKHNSTAPQHLQIQLGDYVAAINGCIGKEAIKKAMEEASNAEMVIRPCVQTTVKVDTKGRALGLYLNYNETQPEITITSFKPDSPALNKLQPLDRIFAVDGVEQAKAMVDQLKRAQDLQSMSFKVKRAKPFPSSGPVDISSLTRIAKDDRGLLPQPINPISATALVQIYVRGQPFGGSDKSSSGHRYDTIPIANGMINAGMSCQLIHYVKEEHDTFLEVCKQFKAIVVRCNPGQIKADGGDQVKFDGAMRELRKLGIQVWPSPDVMEQMGAKDALVKVANLNIGLEDTLAYYTENEFAAGFKKTMAFQPRVIKQNRGSSGEGIWIVKLKQNNYCSSYGKRSCDNQEVLILMEANDNHAEEHTVAEFVEFCVNGRNTKSGTWTSQGDGKYLEGGKAAGGQLVDQRFCPRIVEGELRYNMAGDSLVGIIHKKPKLGGISAVSGTGSIYTFYGPEEIKFQNLTDNFLKRDMAKIMPSIGLEREPIPLWWTTDFINASPPGTKLEDEKWIVGEFNCSCVGISKCLPAYCKDDTPNACFDDIPKKDQAEVKKIGSLVGKKGLSILAKVAAAKRQSAAEESLKALLKTMGATYAGDEALVKKLMTWKRS